ncbi:MAG TPA: DegT/DnrJ/EryC1/StrS family aminotransferase [Terriglobales bacterium]|jgi:perosamine synthetase
MTKFHIPLARPEITDADREAVLQVLCTPDLSFGPKLTEFEEAIASYLRVDHAVAVNSGTSALHLALRTLDLPAGSEVILPSFAFAAPLNVLLQEKLTPVFVDIAPSTLNTTAELVEAAMTPRTRAIIAIHTFGRPVDAAKLRDLADRRGLYLIEDACEALGSEINGHKAGSFGHISILAFYPNKQITTGEGGILVTSSREFADHARRLRNQGRDPSLDWYQQAEIGYSYRLSEMNCALGLEQLKRIESIVERRQAIAGIYDQKLSSIPEIVRPAVFAPGCRISWFVYVVQLASIFNAADRNALCAALALRGIATARYFAPLHLQPIAAGLPISALPHTEFTADRLIALPFFNQLTESQIEEVCLALKESLGELRSTAKNVKQIPL